MMSFKFLQQLIQWPPGWKLFLGGKLGTSQMVFPPSGV